MISLKEILEYCQVEALANRFSPTDISVWRSMCRSYSMKFNTPLHLVLEMDVEHVVLNLYENQAEDLDIEDYQKLEHIMDVVRGIEDPNYEATKKAEQEEFDRLAELEEEERIKSGKAVHKSLQKDLDQKNTFEKSIPEDQKRPTGGMIDLSYLASLDQKEE